MTARIDKDAVRAALTAEAVAAQYGLDGRWAGRWMRSKRCPQTSHPTDAFGLSAEGKWHCWSCDIGGDLLALVAACEGLDARTQFGDVLEVAAAICGVEPEEDFGASTPLRKPRAPAPVTWTQAPLADRLGTARARCEWVWSHLRSPDQDERTRSTGRHWYLESRGLPWGALPDHARLNVRDLGFWTVPGEYQDLARICGASGDHRDAPEPISNAIRRIYSSAVGVAVAVRHIMTGDLVDVRARRAEPGEGEPKILGMVGGVTVDARTNGSELVGCYGNPHALSADLVIVVEGWADYLTACLRWPRADVLGGVDAGSYPLVAAFAARYLAESGRGRLVLVAQDDADRVVTDRNGTSKTIRGAADRAVDNASKRAIGMLGPEAVGFVDAKVFGVHDLNDVARAGRLGELPENP